MARGETNDQPAPGLTWRSFAELFEEAWKREQRRRHLWLLAITLLLATGVLTAVLSGGGGNGSPRANVGALGPHASGSSAPGSSSSARSRFALFNQPSASSQAVRRSMSNYPGLANWMASSTGIGHAATHIVHTSEGTVWVVTGYGLRGTARPRTRGAQLTFPGAAACLIMPGSVGWHSSCAPLMGHNTIDGTDAGATGNSGTWYGFVPNSVKRVIVSYPSRHETTVPVVDNTFLVHLRGTMQQCMSRRTAREAANLSTTSKTFTLYCRD
jgi:hypothetical protein